MSEARRQGESDTGIAIELRTIDRAAFREVYLTAQLDTAASESRPAASPRALFEGLARELLGLSLAIVGEKVFGLASERDAILAARAAAYRGAGLSGLCSDAPLTFIEGRPLGAGDTLAGVQLWGVVPRDPRVSVEPAAADGRSGRIVRGPGFRWIYLAAVDGADQQGALETTAAAQAERMFANADELLAAAGYRYAHVARTWIYCDRILDWYSELNRVRAAHHERVGLASDEGGAILPASTGIQGRTDTRRRCLMDLLAIEAKEPAARLRPLRRSARQGAAASYGSGFSRGMSLELEGRETIFVSGTAAIDGAGESMYRGDAEAQSLATLLAVAELLEEQGATTRDIVAAVVYCKTTAVYRAYQRVTRLLGLPRLPHLAMVADVCRPELLIEIEVVATAER